MTDVTMRRAGPDDAERLWEWANDAGTRRWSYSSEPIPWEGHLEWFSAALADPERVILIGEVDGEAVGVVRFDSGPDEAKVVSVTIAPSQRGRGLAAALIAAGTAEVGGPVDAYIKVDNEASVRAFARAGYELVSTVVEHGEPSFLYRHHTPAVMP